MSLAKRLAKIETSVTPKQAVLSWLKEVQQLEPRDFLKKCLVSCPATTSHKSRTLSAREHSKNQVLRETQVLETKSHRKQSRVGRDPESLTSTYSANLRDATLLSCPATTSHKSRPLSARERSKNQILRETQVLETKSHRKQSRVGRDPRRLAHASTANAAMKTKRKTAADRARGPVRGGVTQLSDDEYRRLAKQQYEAEGEIEIDPNAKVSRSEDHTGEIGAYVQAWVFVYKPER